MPSFPDFSESEYRSRVNKAQNLIDKYGYDALFITQAEHLYYMTGLRMAGIWGTKDRPFGLIVKDGATNFIAAQSQVKNVEGTSWVDNVVTYPIGKMAINAMVRAFEELGLKGAKVGTELSHGFRIGMPVEDFDRLRSEVGGEFVDAANIFWKMRMIKTPLEVDRLRKAAQITGSAMEKAFDSFKEGMTERELASKVGAIMMEEGADFPSFIILYSGERLGFLDPSKRLGGIYPLDIKIRKGDYIQLDCGANYRFYGADMNRLAIVGTKPSQEIKDLWETYKECSDKGIQAMKPGAKAEDVFKAVKKVIDESNIRFTLRAERSGHGLGLEPHEPPDLAMGEQIELEPGMVLAMEVWGFIDPKGRETNIEDNVLITETGSETLSLIDKDLRII